MEGSLMPGEFYIEGKNERTSLQGIEYALTRIEDKIDAVKKQTDKLAGTIPVSGSVTGDWQVSETDLVTIGATGVRYKLHLLVVSIHNLVGNISVRMYMKVNGVERQIHPVPTTQTFSLATHPPAIYVVNGTIGIHEAVRVTVQSDDAGDNGQAVDYDYLLEEMD
jgi:hypothetical protein